jgi:hypothetical protein
LDCIQNSGGEGRHREASIRNDRAWSGSYCLGRQWMVRRLAAPSPHGFGIQYLCMFERPTGTTGSTFKRILRISRGTTRPNVYSSTRLLLSLCLITVIKWPREEGWYLGCHGLPRGTRSRGQGDSSLRARGWGSRRFWRNPATGATRSRSYLFMTVLSISLCQARVRVCMRARAIAYVVVVPRPGR